jgi:hypothetical protein
MKFCCLFLASLFFTFVAMAQQIHPDDLRMLKNREDSMKSNAIKLIQGINAADRFKADSIFTKQFVRALKIPYSFYYPFDSLTTISRLYAPDSSFRIYTWQMVINENVIRQHGAIQMRTNDGSLKLFPLIDKSDVTLRYADTIGNNFGWMGAIYYKILLTKHQDKKYYTLLGFDQNNIRSDKKLVEVLHFENEEPVFGANIFSVPNNSLAASRPARFVLEFKKEAGPRLTYDNELNMIVFEHLVSESNEPNKKWTFIGDGDYEGFKWVSGKWIYVSKIFNQVTPEGKPPVPSPIIDDKGKVDDSKLKEN